MSQLFLDLLHYSSGLETDEGASKARCVHFGGPKGPLADVDNRLLAELIEVTLRSLQK
jgi:hypothetical protein